MARVAWTLTDYSYASPVTYAFEVNPKEAEYPGRKANITSEAGVSPTSATVIFQGKDAVQRMNIDVSIRSQTAYDAFETWANNWYPLVLTDDIGNSFTVLIESFTRKRVRNISTPWRFDATFSFIIL